MISISNGELYNYLDMVDKITSGFSVSSKVSSFLDYVKQSSETGNLDLDLKNLGITLSELESCYKDGYTLVDSSVKIGQIWYSPKDKTYYSVLPNEDTNDIKKSTVEDVQMMINDTTDQIRLLKVEDSNKDVERLIKGNE